MEFKEFTNLDILKTKRMSTDWVAKILGCSSSTVRNWVKKGMFSNQDSISYGLNMCPTKTNSYSIIKVLEWLKSNNKIKYVNLLEEYLSKPYKCESCLYIIKKPECESNNAVLKHNSRYGDRVNYICYDCYMNRIAEEELGIHEEDGVLKSKYIYCIVEKDWDTYSYALEYAKYKNKDLEMIVDRENEETIFIFK